MKRVFVFSLCLVLLTSLILTPSATGDNSFDLGQTWDSSVLVGGIYDLYVWVGDNPEDYTFQWQVDVGMGEGRWSDLEDNANPYGYRGTQTYHMELITSPENNGVVLGSGWEDIPFCCKVTHKKTGVTRYTPNIYMIFHESDDLSEYMAGKGIELYTPSASTSTPTTIDDVTYYTTAEAGQQLTFYCGFKPPQNDPLLGRSEVQADLEIWVTENGKTTKLSSGTYFPYTIGKDKVTAEFRLRHKIGITDLGYYETKILKVSVDEPTVVGIGTAKQSLSLLKEAYGQSQKLITIPKGATVNVYKDSGSWYQVGYGGYVGYVAGSSLNYIGVSPVIDHVELSVAAPVAGNVIPTSVTVKPDSCFVTYVDWEDKTEGRYLEPGERFIKGHDYELVVWAEAKDGYEFKLDSNGKVRTTALLNGNLPCFTSQAYEQIYGKVIDIRYTFTNVKEGNDSHLCAPVAVARIEPTCTAPGHQAYYKCSCGKCYADANGITEINPATGGILPVADHKPGNWTGNGTHHYKKCTVCTQVISGTNAPHSGGTATCLQKAVCTTCNMPYGQISDHRWSPKYHSIDETGHAWICADCKTHDTVIPHTPGPEATDTAPQTCKDCGYILVPAKNHTHNLTKVEQVAATCTTKGNIEHYTCDGCSLRFSDPEGKKEISADTQVTVDALGHTASNTWQYNDDSHWLTCTVCSQVLHETEAAHQMVNSICTGCGWDGQSVPTAPSATEPDTQPETGNPTPQPVEKNDDTGIPGWLPIVGIVAMSILVLLLLGVLIAVIVAALLAKKKKK